MESAMLGESVEADPGAAIAGPKERAKRTHTGKPHIGNAKAKAPKVPGRKRLDASRSPAIRFTSKREDSPSPLVS
jgi:hypothetical protein